MKKVYKIILGLIFVAVTLLLGIYIYAYLDKLEINEKRSSITIYDVNGDILYESNFKKNMRWTSIDDIPKQVRDAFVSVEDKRFYSHAGFDPIRMIKALGTNMKNKGIVEGGSTITQQYAKNLFLSNEQTVTRKVEEFFYAARLEMQYSKDEILEGYLNTLYFGHGIYGVGSAAKFFFDKNLKDLNIGETAMLVGIPNGPSIYSPFISIENATKRQHLILDVLEHNDVISAKEKKKAEAQTLVYSNAQEQKETYGIDEYYIDSVIHDLQQRKDIDLNKELHVYTYYDPDVQKKLTKAIHDQSNLQDELESAGVVLQPFTGNILAISGGKDYTLSQYNRATNSQRQIASTVKPLLYYCALQQGFTPSSLFTSQPTEFTIDDKNSYAPANYADKYPYKDISMINAISLSDNIYAVKTHLFLGSETLANALHDFGITQAKPDASLALGTVNMSILELSKIYNTFASEGLYTEPAFISTITDDKGEVIYQREVKPKRLLQRDETLILNQMLTSTYDSKNISHTVPTLIDSIPDVKVAGKSGTSEWDSLIVGFNPDYTVGIWSGYDDNKELEKKYYTVPKKIWQETFNLLYEDAQASWYQPSDHLIRKIVNPITGKEDANGSEYWYLRTSEDQKKYEKQE